MNHSVANVNKLHHAFIVQQVATTITLKKEKEKKCNVLSNQHDIIAMKLLQLFKCQCNDGPRQVVCEVWMTLEHST